MSWLHITLIPAWFAVVEAREVDEKRSRRDVPSLAVRFDAIERQRSRRSPGFDRGDDRGPGIERGSESSDHLGGWDQSELVLHDVVESDLRSLAWVSESLGRSRLCSSQPRWCRDGPRPRSRRSNPEPCSYSRRSRFVARHADMVRGLRPFSSKALSGYLSPRRYDAWPTAVGSGIRAVRRCSGGRTTRALGPPRRSIGCHPRGARPEPACGATDPCRSRR